MSVAVSSEASETREIEDEPMGIRIRASGGRRDDWRSFRESIDLAEVIARCLGTAPGRAGSRGDRKWWRCPFHDDRNPSLCVRPGERR